MKLENEEWSYPTVQINEAIIESYGADHKLKTAFLTSGDILRDKEGVELGRIRTKSEIQNLLLNNEIDLLCCSPETLMYPMLKQNSWIDSSADNKLENLQFEEPTLFRTIKSFKETCSRFSKLATMGLFDEFDAIVKKGTKYKKDTKYTLQLSNGKDYETTSLIALLNKLVAVKEQSARNAAKFQQEQDIKEEKEALKKEGLTDDQIANVSFYGDDNHMICPSLKSFILCLSEFSLTEQEEMLSQLPLAMRKNEKGKYVPLNIVKALELHTNAKA